MRVRFSIYAFIPLALAMVMLPRLSEAASGLTVGEPFGVSNATSLGDRAALDRLQQSPVEDVRRMATAYLLRLDGKFDASSASADQCYAWAVEKSHFMTASRCLTIKAGNAFILGDDKAAVDGFSQIREVFDGHVLPTLPAGTHYWPALFTPQAKGDWVAAENRRSLDLQAGHYPITYSHGALPHVRIRINGRDEDAIFDTGSSKSAISDDVAATLGLHADGQWMGSNAGSGEAQYLSRYVASLELFGKPVGTRSFAGLKSPGLVMIGLDVMRAMGRFAVSAQGIDLLAANDPLLLNCKEPMEIGSSDDGTSASVYLPVVADGVSSRAVFDTGHATWLSRYVGTAPIHWPASEWVQRRMLRANSQEVTYSHTSESYVGLADAPFVNGPLELTTSLREEPGTFTVGAQALETFRFVFDFPRHHVCASTVARERPTGTAM